MTASDSRQQTFDGIKQAIAEHPAAHHPVFQQLAALSASGKMTAEQFALIRHFLFSRIAETIPHIAEYHSWASRFSGGQTQRTALQNLMEEGVCMLKGEICVWGDPINYWER